MDSDNEKSSLNPDIPPEDTMSEIVEDNQDDDLISIHSENDFTSENEKSMRQLVNVNSSNLYHEPTCVICSSSIREKVEKMSIDKTPKEEIINYIKSHFGIELSNSLIETHMIYHYDKGVREHMKTAYIDRLRRLSSQETTTLSKIKTSINALTERIVGINSIVPCGDFNEVDIEKIKSQETTRLTKTMTQLLQLQAEMMGEMSDSGELITIPKSAFVKFFNDAIISAESDVEREVINRLISGLGELAKM